MGVAHLRWVLSSYRRPQREVAKSLQTAILRKLREKLFDWRPDSPPDFNMVVKDRLDELCTNLELMKLNEAGPDQKKDHLLVRAGAPSQVSVCRSILILLSLSNRS